MIFYISKTVMEFKIHDKMAIYLIKHYRQILRI